MKIKFATWNIGGDLNNSNNQIMKNSYDKVADIIVKKDFDIFAIQEGILESKELLPIGEYLSEKTNLKYYSDFILSKSDNNINDMAGVSILSKVKFDNVENYMFENPKIKCKKSEDITDYSHDKGLNIVTCADMKLVVISGHLLPFHIFRKNAIDYRYILAEVEEKILNQIQYGYNVIFAGDFNFEKPFELFPKLKNKLRSVFTEMTSIYNKQIDFVLVSENIKILNYEVLDYNFDHMLCSVEIEV